MVVDWTVLSIFVIGFFILGGFTRGWWREAVTTAILAFLVFLLANPDIASTFIGYINSFFNTIWNFIPDGLQETINQIIVPIFGVALPIQLDAASARTWMLILMGSLVVAVIFSRLAINREPTLTGKFLGSALGAINGFLVLSLIREYVDGRALPEGREVAQAAGIEVIGKSDFAQPLQTMAIDIVGLPTNTVLDNVLPWLIAGMGLLFVFALFKSRVTLDRNTNGSKLKTKVPPFYKAPKAPPKPKSADEVIQKLFK